MTQRKYKQKSYTQNIFGFSADALNSMEEPPTPRQFIILTEILKLWSSKHLKHYTSRGEKFVWISYSVLFRNLKWFNISRRTMTRDIVKLEDLGLIKTFENDYGGKSQMYFSITEYAKDLLIYTVAKCDTR